jgi:hypothetical protein
MRVLILPYAADVLVDFAAQVEVCLCREAESIQIKLLSSMHNISIANSALRQ